ncbi:MAG: alpha/beta hydrolase, partial [Betaproteobacteria bacterium]|nr:alpha/beta hydrolase [Betaproteobacteria bacterium]
MPTIRTDDGVNLYYEEAGSGTALLFVHEFAGDWRSWEPQMRYFSRRYRCISYSARGYLPSDVPADWNDYSQARVRDDMLSVLDALSIDRAHIVGLSMGAFATLHFGMVHGVQAQASRARSLTLAGVGSGAHPAHYQAFQTSAIENAELIDNEGMPHFASTYGHGAARVQFLAKDPRGFAEYERQLAEHSALGSSNTMRGYQGRRPSLYALTDAIAAINVPTLIMSGDEDEPCLEPSLMLKRTIKTSQLAILPGSGHGINLEEPGLFNQLLAITDCP